MNRFFKIAVVWWCMVMVSNTLRAQDNVIDEVIWIVGDEAILRSEEIGRAHV